MFFFYFPVDVSVVHQLSNRNPHGGLRHGGPRGDNSGRHLALQPSRQTHRQVRVGCFPWIANDLFLILDLGFYDSFMTLAGNSGCRPRGKPAAAMQR